MAPLTALCAALCLVLSVSARPARRDRLADDDGAFALERRDPNFGCHWAVDSTGVRSFWCPSPCRLDSTSRTPGEEARPQHWRCPPTIATVEMPKEVICKWKRSGRLACPSTCGWRRSADAWAWECAPITTLAMQSVAERHQRTLGWSSGPVDPVEHRVRSSYLCPANELACPLRSKADVGATLVPTGSYECVNASDSLDSCGGCSTMPGSGQDCGAIKHAHAGCVAGRCVILSCSTGYAPYADGKTCIRAPHSL